MILICISLVISHVEHLFTYLFSICIGKLHLDFLHPEVMCILSDQVKMAEIKERELQVFSFSSLRTNLIFENQCNWTLCGLRDTPWEGWRPPGRTRKM